MFTGNKSHGQGGDLVVDLDQPQSNFIGQAIMCTKQHFKEILCLVITICIGLRAVYLFREGPTLDFWTIHSSPSTAWAVTPLLAYPFLPSRGRFSIPCEVFLIWPTVLGITHQCGTIFLDWFYNKPLSHQWQFWQGPLILFTLLAGCDRLFSKRRDKPDEKDFHMSSEYSQIWLAVQVLFWVLIPCYQGLADEAYWLWYVVRLLVLLIYAFAYSQVSTNLQRELIEPAVYYFTSRRVPRWKWLPENGAQEDFEPVGSKILAGWVLVMPFVLTVYMGI